MSLHRTPPQPAGAPVPGTNRRSVPNSEGQCFFVSIGNALIALLPVVTFNDNSWYRGSRGRHRLLVSQMQLVLAKYVREFLSDEAFHKIFPQTDKEAYANRLVEAGNRPGRQDWGGLGDLQIMDHWLQTASNFSGSLYTFVKGHNSLTRVTSTQLFMRQPPGNVNDNDIVLYNSGNIHWMNTVATAERFPPTTADGHGHGMSDEEKEIIQID